MPIQMQVVRVWYSLTPRFELRRPARAPQQFLQHANDACWLADRRRHALQEIMNQRGSNQLPVAAWQLGHIRHGVQGVSEVFSHTFEPHCSPVA